MPSEARVKAVHEYITDNGPASIDKLASYFRVSTGAISEAIVELQLAGLVGRGTKERTGRKSEVVYGIKTQRVKSQ